jgi:hypothetical protein
MNTLKRSLVARSSWERGINKCSPGDFEGSETILYDTIMMNTYYNKFAETHGM